MSREPTSARAPNSDGGGSPSKEDTQAEGDGDGGETTSDGDGSDRRKKNGFLLGGEKAKDASIQVRREEKVAACSGFSRSDDVGLEKENNLHCNSIFTLFVDGISDGVNYLQVRGLFAQIGRVLNVFIQRQRKIGRSHRFGFARFSSLEVASQAINLLDGFRLGGTPLSVAWARFPRRGVAGSRVFAARDQRSSEHAGVLAGIGESTSVVFFRE
ncbi:polyadenylate-binding protein RBP45B-like [Lotus japonicus]|uniref:polyadenylate-binding protein RBP45B-like n=1 Tax=Lotus japonicus TaxID=34305 RepID=UPI00258DF410|nr:polyadenylate-binding protein RBP45B-like [Lotus japonicus]